MVVRRIEDTELWKLAHELNLDLLAEQEDRLDKLLTENIEKNNK